MKLHYYFLQDCRIKSDCEIMTQDILTDILQVSEWVMNLRDMKK